MKGINMYYIGLLSGTSVDTIDAAIFQFQNTSTHDNSIQMMHGHAHPIPSALKKQTLALSQSGHTTLTQIGELDTQWGHLFANSIQTLLMQSGLDAQQILAIGSHGQTIWHQPLGDLPFTMQIGNPHIIAKTTGIPTIADFRRGDMALGGQGAPLAPAFHEYYFYSPIADRIIINLGGISNISYLPKNKTHATIGYDTGPANSLLDGWCLIHQNQSYDAQGQWAQTGTIHIPLLTILLSDPYFAKPYPKSTGKDYFNLQWLNQYIDIISNHISHPIPPEDIQATLTELTAITLVQAISDLPVESPPQIILCGGGLHNTYLLSRIQYQLNAFDFSCDIIPTPELGIHPDWIEAALFAWLAKNHIENIPLDYRHITGARKPTVLGVRQNP